MAMLHRSVMMRVAVRFARRIVGSMAVLMVRIVRMDMLMVHRLMGMCVCMVFRQVQI